MRWRGRTGGLTLGSTLILVAGLASATVAGIEVRHELASAENAIAGLYEIQVSVAQIANRSRDVLAGGPEVFNELATHRDAVEQVIRDLDDSHAGEGFRTSGNSGGRSALVRRIVDRWGPLKKNVDLIRSRKELVLGVTASAADMDAALLPLNAKLDELVTLLRQKGAPGDQIYLASRQSLLTARMQRRVAAILKGGDAAVVASDGLGRDAGFFGRVLAGFRDGAPELNLRALTDPEARAVLADLVQMNQKMSVEVETIIGASTDLFEVNEAVDTIALDSQTLLQGARDATDALSRRPWTERSPSLWWLLASMAAVFVTLLVVQGRPAGNPGGSRGGVL